MLISLAGFYTSLTITQELLIVSLNWIV